jgi:hypothetical protein
MGIEKNVSKDNAEGKMLQVKKSASKQKDSYVRKRKI